MTVVVLLISGVGSMVLLGAAPAQAHTGLVRSNPVAGEEVPLARDHLTLEFDEQLLPGSDLVVRGPDGLDVTQGEVGVLGAAIDVGLGLTTPGEHTVAYRVVGHDGHPQIGTFTFTAVGQDALSPVSQRTGAGPLPPGTVSPGSTVPAAAPSGPPGWLVPTLGLAALLLLVHTAGGARARRRVTEPSTSA